MKKCFMTLFVALSATAGMAQVITFQKTEHDFGKINEADGRVTTIFSFKNEGMDPLVLSNVRASCGCTTPKWPHEPIEPGQVGEITVTYNPNGRPGRFQKTITVTSNAKENTTLKLYIKGEVIPKPAKPVNEYPVIMGDLSLKAKNVNLGNILKGQTATREIEYANKTDHEVTVDLATRSEDNYLASQITLATVKPNETGKIMLMIDAQTCPLYGPVELSAYVVVNNKKELTETYRLDIRANIVEDFSQMTDADRQAAPILETTNAIDFGVLQAGKKYKKSFSVHNAGLNALFVRRVYSANSNVSAQMPKGAIKSGKKTDIRAFVVTSDEKGNPLAAGKYSREMTIITNDPKRPTQQITISWTIE